MSETLLLIYIPNVVQVRLVVDLGAERELLFKVRSVSFRSVYLRKMS